MKTWIPMAISIMLCLACTKFGKNVTVKGRILNPLTGQGISGAKIWLQKSRNNFDGGYKTVKEVISDENGYYELDKLGLAGYRATCQTGDHYDLGWTTDNGASFTSNFWLNVKKGKTRHADYYALPYGMLQVHIRNIACFDQNDQVQLYFDGEQYNSTTFNGGLLTTLQGCVDITDPPVKSTVGNKYFHWSVTKDNVLTEYYDTVTVTENSITTLDVFY